MTWTGRFDGDGPEHARWFQRIRRDAPDGPHIALLGFASDEGVRRNAGRPGAAAGPEALRGALGGMSLHSSLADGSVRLHDLGDITVSGEDLEHAQETMGERIGAALRQEGNLLTVVLGGGHETAWASYLGLRASGLGDQRWGVLNFDAHFDLREAERPTSGTPFRQMAEAQRCAGRALRYAVVGISEHANTGALFETAQREQVEYLIDVDCDPATVVTFVERFAQDLDVLYVTIDLDVFPAANAPGVSAPAALGVTPQTVIAGLRAAAATGKVRLLDVVELNPRFDEDTRTARLGARLIAEVVSRHSAARVG